MLEKIGKVVDLLDRESVVEVQGTSSGCCKAGGCAIKHVQTNTKKQLVALNPVDFDVAIGDLVKVVVPERSLILATFLLL